MTPNERDIAGKSTELPLDNVFRLLGVVFDVSPEDADDWWLDMGYVDIPGELAV